MCPRYNVAPPKKPSRSGSTGLPFIVILSNHNSSQFSADRYKAQGAYQSLRIRIMSSHLLPASILERALLGTQTPNLRTFQIRGDFIRSFFRSWSWSSLVSLSKTNFTLYCLVHWYISDHFDIHRFLQNWFDRPQRILRLMDHHKAVLCGPNVLRFFHGTLDPMDDIDICVTADHIESLVQELTGQNYVFYVSKYGNRGNFANILMNVVRSYGRSGTNMTAERGTDSVYHGAHLFVFTKNRSALHKAQSARHVVVRLVRCEPYRHILSQHSSTYHTMIWLYESIF